MVTLKELIQHLQQFPPETHLFRTIAGQDDPNIVEAIQPGELPNLVDILAKKGSYLSLGPYETDEDQWDEVHIVVDDNLPQTVQDYDYIIPGNVDLDLLPGILL